MLSKLTKISFILISLQLSVFLFLILSSTPVQAAPNSSMPNWSMPIPKLQIPIDTIKFTAPEKCGGTDQNPVYCVNWIGQYISGIYKYAIGVVGILAAIVLMIGGVIWIMAGGNSARVGEAKAYLGASLTGLIIALTSYMILYQVNPDLLNFKAIKVTLVNQEEQPKPSSLSCNIQLKDTGCDAGAGYKEMNESYCTSVAPSDQVQAALKARGSDLGVVVPTSCCCQPPAAGSAVYGKNCQPITSGPCEPGRLSLSFSGTLADQASAICQGESGGIVDRPSGMDYCRGDNKVVSWGLFQINISANPIGNLKCPSAFDKPYKGSDKNCQVIDNNLYEQCKNAAIDPAQNIAAAFKIYQDANNSWKRWSFYNDNCSNSF